MNLPNYNGCKHVEFIYHGEWSDAELRYKNIVANHYDVEEAMYSDYLDELDGEESESGFAEYCRNNEYRVIEFICMMQTESNRYELLEMMAEYICDNLTDEQNEELENMDFGNCTDEEKERIKTMLYPLISQFNKKYYLDKDEDWLIYDEDWWIYDYSNIKSGLNIKSTIDLMEWQFNY